MSENQDFTFEDCVQVLGTPANLLNHRAQLRRFLNDPDKLLRLLKLIRDGLEMDFAAANHVRATALQNGHQQLMGDFWAGDNWFDEDATFTNARFQLIVSTWPTRPHSPTAYARARDQVQRLLLAGRVNVIQVDGIADPLADDDHVTGLLNACSLSRQARLIDEVDRLRELAAFDDDKTYAYTQQLVKTRGQLHSAHLLQQQLFVSLWLPTQISAEEYEQAKDLHPTVLQNLYANAWQAGYSGYRGALISGRM